MTSRPVLIVFAREPTAGRTKTRLLSHLTSQQAADLSLAFLQDTLAKAKRQRPSELLIAARVESSAGAEYFRKLGRRFQAEVVDQGAGGLGRRMARSLSPFVATGALLIGTDVPSLPDSALHELLTILVRRRLVLGPSLDGGYYAVGLRGPMPSIFTGISWGTRMVLRQTMMHARRDGISVALGPVWHDVDRWGDLKLLSSYLTRFESRALPEREHPCPATAAALRRLGLLSSRK